MIDVNDCDFIQLFLLRYALDKPNDIVNLERDILDLQYFPERLQDSYLAEWKAYIKPELIALQRRDEHHNLANIMVNLEQGDNPHFNRLYDVIKTADKVNNSDAVTVMTTPFKSFVNQLLKI